MKRYVKASSNYNKYSNYTYKGQKYGIHYTEFDGEWEDLDSQFLFNNFKEQITEIHPYDDANYYWASIADGKINYCQDGKVKKTDFYLTPDDMDLENYEWVEQLGDIAIETLYDLNKNIESRMMYD